MKITFSRIVVAAAAVTVIASFYSLSVVHRISSLHAATDDTIPFERKASKSPIEEKQAPQAERKSLAQGSASNPAAANSPAATTTPTPSTATTTNATGLLNGKTCYPYEHTELWGDVLAWGSSNKVDTAGECCDKCRSFKPDTPDGFECNVWVYCGSKETCGVNYKECWLKHLAHPTAAKPAKEGPDVPWTSGTINVDMQAKPSSTGKKELRKFHIVTSAQGAAVHWQIRIHYYWYKKQKHQCEQEEACEMGGFTRLLHSGQADDLMDEIPTMVVDPLPSSMVEHSWYIVLNRPYAFVQWVKKANIPEKYVLMAEPDHVMIRPLPNFMTSEAPAAFPFFYIEPGKAAFQKVTMKFTGPMLKRQLDEIAPIGNSPTFMALEDMKRTMPLWMNTSIAIFKDKEASAAWGWVQEMYGFAFALWLAGIKRVDLYLHMMAQPPWDSNLEMSPGKNFHIIHYTYGMDYKLTGEFTPGKYGEWRFDKRSFTARPLPRHLGEPPKDMKNDLVRTLINSFNEATAAIPCWEQYATSGKLPAKCDEKPGGFLAVEAELKEKAAKVA